MKKALALVLALVMLVGASPAYAYRMYFSSVDNNPVYDVDGLITNWIGSVEGWGTEYEMDIGDLAAASTGTVEGVGDVQSPTVTGTVPLRSYIIDPQGQARTFDLLISNEEQDIYPKEALNTIDSTDLNQSVEGFEELAKLLSSETGTAKLDPEKIQEFSQKYNDKLVSVYTAVDYYMKGAGYEASDYGDINTLATALYVIMNYFPIGPKLQEMLDDDEMNPAAVFLCAEMYKGFYATFLRDEVTMAEFSYVIYLWMQNTEEKAENGTPYALATYVPAENRWVLVDVFQIALVGDHISSDEIMNVMIDTRFFMDADGQSSVIALRYNNATQSWQIAGMNRAAYFDLLNYGYNGL